MRGYCRAFVLLAASTQSLFAQQAAPLDDTQRLGQALFVQSCGVCHLKPQLRAVQFGPVLSTASAGGREDVMREIIADGTPRMPGFKHQFDQTQIAAIAAYLKTIPVPPQAAPQPARQESAPARAERNREAD